MLAIRVCTGARDSPGGPYLKIPWEKIYKVRIATTTLNIAVDLEGPHAHGPAQHGLT
jgi:hypothetical protein